MWRDSDGKIPNIMPRFPCVLSEILKFDVSVKEIIFYFYGILAHPIFTETFRKVLENRELRVPITKDVGLFKKVGKVGRKLLWLHTYGERFVPRGKGRGTIPRGAARCRKPVSESSERYPDSYGYTEATQTIQVGDGEFGLVSAEVWRFEVSGLKVVQSWLGYRMANRKGKKSSPLDDIHPERWTAEFTTEFLNLLWILEATLKIYPTQAELLVRVVDGPLIRADELPAVPEAARKPPKNGDDVHLWS